MLDYTVNDKPKVLMRGVNEDGSGDSSGESGGQSQSQSQTQTETEQEKEIDSSDMINSVAITLKEISECAEKIVEAMTVRTHR